MRRLFGTDGVRGIANATLTCEGSMAIGRALGSLLREKENRAPTVILASDTRLSSPMLSDALTSGLLSVGANVSDLGVLPTPAVAYLVRKYGASAGVMISASHNPYEYNGIKIFGGGGFKLSDELEEEIEKAVLDGSVTPKLSEPENIGRKIEMTSAKEDYVNYIISHGKRLEGLRVGIDAANGATAEIAEKIFTSLGAQVRVIGNSPDGININRDCGSTHLDAIARLVRELGLDLGVAFDGDGDRCIAVDAHGSEVDGDFIMAIMARKLLAEGNLKKNTVVGTVMTNFGFVKFCEENGINFISTRVGDRYVLEVMCREGYSLGGEQSGHIIFRDCATTGDGLLTAVLLLSHVSETKTPLDVLAGVMKKYPQYSENIPATETEKSVFVTDEEIKRILTAEERELEGRGKIVARPSGTEPYIRITAEGDDIEKTKSTVRRLRKKIEAWLGLLG